jgi:hypothetical protein
MVWKARPYGFVFWELRADVVEPEEVAVLGDHLARELDRGLLGAPRPEEYAEELGAREGLRTLGEQPLARPELGGQLLDGVPSAHGVILLIGAVLYGFIPEAPSILAVIASGSPTTLV